MKTNTFITLSTATANIGVLIGLVFLIFELRQNSAIALSQIRQERTLSVIDEYTSYAQDERFSDLLSRLQSDGDFGSITKREWQQIRYYELARSVRLDDVLFQHRQGLIDDGLFRFSMSIAASRLPLWKWLNVGEPTVEFAEAIEAHVDEDDFKQSKFAAMFSEWSADKDSPNLGIGSPTVFE